MHLKSLQLANFKNFKEFSFKIKADFVGIVGDNGKGKTSILDAIHYLSLTKSYINLIDKYNIHFNENFFFIKALLESEEEFQIQLTVQEGSKKIVKKNNKAYSKISDHIGCIKSVVISPYDRDLIWEGSEVRRKFMDHLISQIDKTYLQQLIRYNKALNQRNSLLKFFKENNSFDQLALDSYNEELTKSGSYIYIKRKEIVEEFIPIFRELYQEIAQNEEEVSIAYSSHLDEHDFKKLFRDSLLQDRHSGFTQKGIHKDDLEFSLHHHPVKRTASQGQQKTFLIALKLAQVQFLTQVTQEKPILLLDDIFDKLDQKRVQFLIQLIEAKNLGQVFITDTDSDRIKTVFEQISLPTQMLQL